LLVLTCIGSFIFRFPSPFIFLCFVLYVKSVSC
jgi:hypothetical protein